MVSKSDVGIRIRTMRQSRNMTQSDLARSIGQSASSITMYETGRREPEFEVLEAMADVFNVPLFSLISDDDFTRDEIDLVHSYRSLLPKGQQLLLERIEELKVLYGKKPEDNAAESV